MSVPGKYQSGLTLISLLTALGLLAVMTGLAFPAWQQQVERHRLTAGVTAVYDALAQTRREAVMFNRPLIFAFQPENALQGWCFTTTVDAACDCRAAHCSLPSGTRRPVREPDFPRLRLKVLPRDGRIRFYPARGTTSAGSIELRVGDALARVIVSSLGRIRVCSPSLWMHPPCR